MMFKLFLYLCLNDFRDPWLVIKYLVSCIQVIKRRSSALYCESFLLFAKVSRTLLWSTHISSVCFRSSSKSCLAIAPRGQYFWNLYVVGMVCRKTRPSMLPTINATFTELPLMISSFIYFHFSFLKKFPQPISLDKWLRISERGKREMLSNWQIDN